MKKFISAIFVISTLSNSLCYGQELTGIVCKILPAHGEVSLRNESEGGWRLKFSGGYWNEPLDHQFTEMLLKLDPSLQPAEDVEKADFHLKGCSISANPYFDGRCQSPGSAGMVPFRDKEQQGSPVLREILNAKIDFSISVDRPGKYAMRFYVKEGNQDWSAVLTLGNCNYLYRAN